MVHKKQFFHKPTTGDIIDMATDPQKTPTAASSISPSGEPFAIPAAEDYRVEFQRVEKLVEQARSEGKEIVVVMGVGFVGAVMAAIIADTQDEAGSRLPIRVGPGVCSPLQRRCVRPRVASAGTPFTEFS